VYTSVTFGRETEGAGRVRTARVGHLFECDDGARLRVLAIDSGDPTTILMEGGRMLSVPCGSIFQVEGEASPKAVRTEKAVLPAAVAEPVHRGQVKSIVYHHGHKRHELVVGQLVDGRFRLTAIFDGDPVHINLLDARREITSREVCGLGSVSQLRYAA
jgi:hypothetical protein